MTTQLTLPRATVRALATLFNDGATADRLVDILIGQGIPEDAAEDDLDDMHRAFTESVREQESRVAQLIRDLPPVPGRVRLVAQQAGMVIYRGSAYRHPELDKWRGAAVRVDRLVSGDLAVRSLVGEEICTATAGRRTAA